MSKVQELVNKLKEFEEKFKEESRAAFAEGCRELFANNPELESFGFQAFTPHFNDGDTCEYSVYADCPNINELRGYDVYSIKDESKKKKIEELQKIVSNFVFAFPTKSIKNIFPDHSEITIYRDGRMEVEDYDHD